MNIIFSKLKPVLFFLALVIFLVPSLSLAAYPAPTTLPDETLVVEEVVEENETVNLYFFYSKTCPHCQAEALFLSRLQKEYGDSIEIYSYEVTGNQANAQLYEKFGQEFEVSVNMVPGLFIGERHIAGYYNDENTGAQIQNLIDQCLALGCHDVGQHILNPDEECDYEKEEEGCEQDDQIVKVPIIGQINLKNTSILVATVVLGGLDGFNPCAMWVLIFLISLLLGIQSVRRRWTLGLTFIVASGLVYYLFMVAWLNMFLFIGYMLIVRIIVGGLAIAFGIYNLNKYRKDKAGVCEVTDTQSRQKILTKIKNVALNKKLLPAMVGIVLLAFAVNVIELACSAGFPAIYTKMLAMQNFAGATYYLYILLYIIIFMLDDMIVFAIAMVTLRLTGVDSKYAKYSNLIGGIIILILGILLILKPNWLMFG